MSRLFRDPEVDGRPCPSVRTHGPRGQTELVEELSQEDEDLGVYVVNELSALNEDPYFDYLIQDLVDGYGDAAVARAELVRERMRTIIDRLRR